MLDINPTKQSEQVESSESMVQNTITSQPKPVFESPAGFGNREQKTPRNIFMESEEKNSKMVGIFTIIILVIFLAVAGVLYFLHSQKSSQLATKNTKIEELKTQLAKPELAQIEEQATRYSAGLKELSGFIGNSPSYSLLLKRLGELTPNEIKLTNFSVDAKNKILISGKATDNMQLSAFIKSLQNAKEFSDVTLDKNQLTSEDLSNGAYFNFGISANLNIDKLLSESKKEALDNKTTNQ